MRRLLPWLLVLAACAHPATTWFDATTLRAPAPARHPGAAAVILLDEERYAVRVSGQSATTTMSRHVVTAVLDEAGAADAVEVHLRTARRIGKGGVTTDSNLRARVIRPDGTTLDIPPDRIIETQTVASEALEVNERILRFPDARAGTLLEYVYDAERDGAFDYRWDAPPTRFPVERYRVVVDFPATASVEFFTHNSTVRPRIDEDANHLELELDDLPARQRELWEVPSQEVVPWWEMRLATRRRLTTWTDLGGWLARRWKLSHVFDGLQLAVHPSGDCDTRCRVDRAVAYVRDTVELDEGAGVRPLREVVAAGRAREDEKAALLWRALDRLGVEVEIAAAGRTLEVRLPVQRFEHLLVHVPAQEGLLVPLWIDPSCERCAPGELPRRWLTARALIERDDQDPDHRRSELVPVVGKAASEGVGESHLDARLNDAGDLAVDARQTRRADEAVRYRLLTRDLTATQRRALIEGALHVRQPTARLEGDVAITCARTSGECETRFHYVMPGYAALDGDKLLVPLAALTTSFDLDAPPQTRAGDIYFERASGASERLTLHPPPGWQVEELPTPVNFLGGGMVNVHFSAAAESGNAEVRRSIDHPEGRYPRSAWDVLRRALVSYASLRQKVIGLRRVGAPAR